MSGPSSEQEQVLRGLLTAIERSGGGLTPAEASALLDRFIEAKRGGLEASSLRLMRE